MPRQRPLSMQEAELKPLNGLYQLIEPPHGAACDRALIAVAQLRRKPLSKRAKAEGAATSTAQQGALEWVVGVSAPAQADPEAKGKGRDRPGSDDWWESKMSVDDVTEWLQEVRGLFTATQDPQTDGSPRAGRGNAREPSGSCAEIPERVAIRRPVHFGVYWKRWRAAHRYRGAVTRLLRKSSEEEQADARRVQLIADLSGNKKVSLALSPCAAPPLALESVLLTVR